MRKTAPLKARFIVVVGLFVTNVLWSLLTGQQMPAEFSSFGMEKEPIDLLEYGYKAPLPRTARNLAEAEKLCLGREAASGDEDDDERFDSYFAKPREEHSVNEEDQTLWKKLILPDKRSSGTYIEIGGFDGITESNSRFFDECLGWEGLLVEANTFIYPNLVQNRPHAHRLNYAPSCTEESGVESIQFYATAFTNAGVHGVIPEGQARRERLVNVPCGELAPVLKEVFPSKTVTLFSLDVEGAEPLILQTIDFDEVFIEVLMIESWNVNCPPEPKECATRDKVREIMSEVGYIRAPVDFVKKSDLYIHPESSFLKYI